MGFRRDDELYRVTQLSFDTNWINDFFRYADIMDGDLGSIGLTEL